MLIGFMLTLIISCCLSASAHHQIYWRDLTESRCCWSLKLFSFLLF